MAPKVNLDRLKMPYKEMNAEEIMAEYPFKNLPETFKGLFAVDNGVINVPLLLRTLTRLCSFHGAKIYENAGVKHMETSECGVKVEAVDTQTGEKRWVYAKKAALTCGAYVNDLLGPNFGFELNLSMWSKWPGSHSSPCSHASTAPEARPPAQGRPKAPEGEPLPRGCQRRGCCGALSCPKSLILKRLIIQGPRHLGHVLRVLHGAGEHLLQVEYATPVSNPRLADPISSTTHTFKPCLGHSVVPVRESGRS